MANVDNSDDIVISGIDGKFPKCQNMDELGWSLFNKVTIISLVLRMISSNRDQIINDRRQFYL